MSKIHWFLLVFILFGLSSVSCKKDDDDPLEPNQIVYDTTEYSGDLIVQVNHWDGSHNIPADWGFSVFIFNTYEDAINNEPYLLKVYSNSNGVANCGSLLMGNYYIKGTGEENGVIYTSDVIVTQILPQRTNYTVLTVNQP